MKTRTNQVWLGKELDADITVQITDNGEGGWWLWVFKPSGQARVHLTWQDLCISSFVSNEDDAKERLEYLRGEIEAERISFSEIIELEALREYIEPDDLLLLQWAGVPEFDEED